jgi:hypothetical protein
VAAALFPKPSLAPPLYDEVDRYYDTCGPNRVVIGEEHFPCSGSSSSWGTTSLFLEEIDTNCNTHAVSHYYFECGVEVSSLDTCVC